MTDSPCRIVGKHGIRGPADEAMPTLVDFSERFNPLADAVPMHQIKEVEPVRQVKAAGFTTRQIASALGVKASTVEHWIEPGQVWMLLDKPGVKALDWLLKIAQARLQAGYMPATTRSWWGSSLQKLGWRQPRQVFHHNPQRVRDSINPLTTAKRIRSEPPGAKRAGWENLPGIFGT